MQLFDLISNLRGLHPEPNQANDFYKNTLQISVAVLKHNSSNKISTLFQNI